MKRLSKLPGRSEPSTLLIGLRTLFGASRRLTLGWIGTILVGATVPTAVIIASGGLVGAIARSATSDPPTDAQSSVVIAAISLLVLFAVQEIVLPPLSQAVGLALGRANERHQSTRVLDAVLSPAGIAHLEDPQVRDQLLHAQGFATGISVQQLPRALSSTWTARMQGVAALGLVAAFSWWIAVVLAVAHLATLRFWQRAYALLTSWAVARGPELRRGDYYRDLAMTPPGAKEVRVFGLGGWVSDRFHSHWLAGMTTVWSQWRDRRSMTLAASAAPTIASLLAFAFFARAALDGALSIGALVIVVQAVQRCGALSAADENTRVGAAAGASARSARDLEAGLAEQGEAITPRAPAGFRTVELEDVTFRYPTSTHPVLEHLHLTIRAGESLAIVGDNGAGKTTLAKLVCGLYRPTSGRILVDGEDLAGLDPRSWQESIAAVFQDFGRYPLSARENVALGYESPDDALGEAAERAGILEAIRELPSGWATPLAREFAGGTQLSGGQWQRVALARALHAASQGARLLILDEPTANLDVRAEAAFNERFLELTPGLSTILVSHRFATVRRAQRIVVIDGGRVVQEGTHSELIAAEGRYATLFRLQAERFSDSQSHA